MVTIRERDLKNESFRLYRRKTERKRVFTLLREIERERDESDTFEPCEWFLYGNNKRERFEWKNRFVETVSKKDGEELLENAFLRFYARSRERHEPDTFEPYEWFLMFMLCMYRVETNSCLLELRLILSLEMTFGNVDKAIDLHMIYIIFMIGISC